jgi:hypothetical protein
LVNKKDFVKSCQYYPLKALNFSYDKKRKYSKGAKASKTQVNTILGCYTASYLEDEIDRYELK